MKYSFVMPYYKRASQLLKTLESFESLYSDRVDWEVVVVEDIKNRNNPQEQAKLFDLLFHFEKKIFINNIVCPVECWNPSPHFNLGVLNSIGRYIVLTSPECLHLNNVLQGFDSEFDEGDRKYVIAACKDDSMKSGWRQHSVHRRTRYHFCSAISKDLYTEIGGFDEEYAKGIAYDDNDFLCKVIVSGVKMVERDDLLTYHQKHEKEHFKLPNRIPLWEHNRDYFYKKWGELGAMNSASESE